MSATLLVRLHNWIGDVVVGLPALQLLESQGLRLELVGKGWAQALLAGHGWPVHVLPKTLGERVALWRRLRERLPAERVRLRGRRVDALLLATSFSAALEARLGGARCFGYDTDSRRWLLTRALPRPIDGHMVEEHWRLACELLDTAAPPPRALGLKLSGAARETARALLETHGVRGPYAVLCPFAIGTLKGRSKVWPDFQRLAHVLLDRGVAVVLCPGPGEEEAARTGFGDCTLLGGADLGVYGALLQGAQVVVANDTGPGHIAAAVGAPLVSVLGPTEPLRWGPWGPTVRIVQRPAGWPTLEAVLEQVEARLAA